MGFEDKLNDAFEPHDVNRQHADGFHKPTPDTNIEVILINLSNAQDDWGIKIPRHNQREMFGGILTVHHAEGLWQGYDWEGSTLTKDELQQVLDLFTDQYEFE